MRDVPASFSFDNTKEAKLHANRAHDRSIVPANDRRCNALGWRGATRDRGRYDAQPRDRFNPFVWAAGQ